MGALPANLSIGRMIRVLALLCLGVLSMGEPEAEAKAVADPKADPYLLYGGYYGLGHHYGGYYGYPSYRVYGKRSAEAEAEAEAAPEAEAKAEADPLVWILRWIRSWILRGTWSWILRQILRWTLWLPLLRSLWQEVCCS